MFEHLSNGEPVVDIAVQHLADQVDAFFRERQEGYAQRVVEDFVDVVERVLLVDDGIQQNPQSPDILLLAAVGFALQDFGGGVV